MTVSQIEPHHQNDHNHYEGPNGSKQRFADFVLPEDLKALGGNAAEEYPDYLGQCASLDENLGKLVSKLKRKKACMIIQLSSMLPTMALTSRPATVTRT